MSEPISQEMFRSALAQLAGGVTVITALKETGPVGFTATAFSSLSLDPPLVLVCIAKKASAHDAVTAAVTFGVSILGKHQDKIALQFATSGIDRFQGIEIHHRTVPLVGGALVQLECKRHAVHLAGDHSILIGEVLHVGLNEGEPLLHYSRKFGEFAPLPPAAKPVKPD